MKVLQLGVGAVGEVTARTMALEPAVDHLVLADLDPARVEAVAALLPAGRADTLVVDVTDGAALREALSGVDFVLNALAPRFDLDVMNAALDTGTHYLDMATGGPREITGTADLDEQLALHERFLEGGLAALVSFGIDPGASDVFARALYDEFDTVESLRVLDGDNGSIEGYDYACSFSPETMIEECLLPPYVLRDGKNVRNQPLSVSFEFDFPQPVGRLRVWNVDHEEAQLMPLHLGGKGLRSADFFIALDGKFVELLQVVQRLGLQSRTALEFGGGRFTPLEFIVSRLPKPTDLYGKIHGHVCVGALATGVRGGRRARKYLYQITSHEGVFAKYGVQGTGYQTGASAACAVTQFARGEIALRGVVAPEQLDPHAYIAEMEKFDLPVRGVELPLED